MPVPWRKMRLSITVPKLAETSSKRSVRVEYIPSKCACSDAICERLKASATGHSETGLSIYRRFELVMEIIDTSSKMLKTAFTETKPITTWNCIN